MTGARARRRILAVVWPFLLAGTPTLKAQTPRAPAPRGADRSASPVAPAASSELPSTVSPAIERFIKEGGRSLLETPGPGAVATPVRRDATPEPRPRQGGGLVGAPSEGSRTADAPARSPAPPPTAPAGTPPPVTFAMKSAPLNPTDVRFPINLATALRLADARPLVVAAAQAGVWVSEADLTQAKILWLPRLNIGFDYIRHDGGGPDFNKGIITAPSVNYFMGGAGANLYVNLTDAYYEPLIARQSLNAAHWDIQTAKNDALLQTAEAYFRVHQHRGNYAGALYTVERGRLLVDRIASLSRELVPTVEVDRARNVLADLEQRASLARQEWRVASADLTQVLRLDPRAVVVPLEHDHAQVTVVDPGRSYDDLMPIALNNRPELGSRRAQVEAAEARVRREKARPLVPIAMINGFQHASEYLQAGIFGLGPNSSLNQWRGRDDVSLQLIWQLEGLGIGNLARVKAQRGNQSRAIIDLRRNQDQIAAEVTRSIARVQSAAARVLQADRALRTGIITFNGHLEGLQQTRRLGDVLVLTFRPQEAVYSLDMLSVAFTEYFTSVAEYNRAQFELFHALGYPAAELERIRPAGDLKPVDTARPPYLPPVGNGPPPASR